MGQIALVGLQHITDLCVGADCLELTYIALKQDKLQPLDSFTLSTDNPRSEESVLATLNRFNLLLQSCNLYHDSLDKIRVSLVVVRDSIREGLIAPIKKSA